MTQPKDGPPIVFFDGLCGLCNRTIDWLIRHDHEEKFRFSPLQGETARIFLTEIERTDLATVVVVYNGQKFRKSAAFLFLLSHLSRPWPALARLMYGVPRVIRDFVYDGVAQNRYAIFKKRDVCRIPSSSERARFLA